MKICSLLILVLLVKFSLLADEDRGRYDSLFEECIEEIAKPDCFNMLIEQWEQDYDSLKVELRKLISDNLPEEYLNRFDEADAKWFDYYTTESSFAIDFRFEVWIGIGWHPGDRWHEKDIIITRVLELEQYIEYLNGFIYWYKRLEQKK